jgi:hypothetical protein
MLARVRGWHAMYVDCKPKDVAESSASSKGSSNQWDPSPEELEAGIEFINDVAPISNNKNQQLIWILKEIRSPGSAIYKWPKSIVQEACANKSKSKHQADHEFWFALTLMDYKRLIVYGILPLIFKLLLTHGLLICGKAGVGKTQFAKSLAMAIGRYWIAVKGLVGQRPSWRRGSMMDVFRDSPGEIQDAILLDDPCPGIADIHVEILKNFLDSSENVQCDARYNPVKFTRNQLRCILCNNFKAEAEPEAHETSIAESVFLDMLSPALRNAGGEHKAAILKRAVVMIAGQHGIYIRLPSEKENQPIHVFKGDDIGEDWLLPYNKGFLNHYLLGQRVEYEGFAESVLKEQEWLKECLLTEPERQTLALKRKWAERWGDEPWDEEQFQEFLDTIPAFPDYSPLPGNDSQDDQAESNHDLQPGSGEATPTNPGFELKEEVSTPPSTEPFGVVDLGYINASDEEGM